MDGQRFKLELIDYVFVLGKIQLFVHREFRFRLKGLAELFIHPYSMPKNVRVMSRFLVHFFQTKGLVKRYNRIIKTIGGRKDE